MTAHYNIETIRERIRDVYSRRHGRMDFTIEHGRGETYASREWTLYAHDSYPRSSVLRGRERRQWVESTDATEVGREALVEACKRAKVQFGQPVASTFFHDSLSDLPGEEL